MKTATTSTRQLKKKTPARPPTRTGRPFGLIRKRGIYVAIALLIVIAFACYANSLWNGFVFDDHQLLTNARPKSFANLLKILFSSYRPVRNISYAIDFGLWGARPFGFHLTNVLIHAANTIMILFLVRLLTNRLVIAFLAALIFCVHPIQTDAVAYISGRRDVLFSFFYIAAFYSYVKYRQSNSAKHFAAFLALWAISLMSKEMAVSLPLVVFIWNLGDVWREGSGSLAKRSVEAVRKVLVRDKWLYASLLLAVIGFAWFTVFYQKASSRAGEQDWSYWGGSFYTTILTVIRVHAWYVKQLVYPTPIAQYYGAFDPSTSLLDWRVLVSLIVVLPTLIVGFLLLNRHKLMAFAILSYFAMLLPVSQIIPHHELVADHYLYLPMMSFGLLVAMAITKIANERTRRVAYAAVGVAVVALAIMTVIRNTTWESDFTVWKANYEAAPNSPRATYNLAVMFEARDPEKAEVLFRRTLELDPTFDYTYVALARFYVGRNRPTEAEDLIQKGLALTDASTDASASRNPALLRSQLLTMRAWASWKAGQLPKAEKALRLAIATYPPNPEPYMVMANLYHNDNRAKEEETLKQAVDASPFTYEANARLVMLLLQDKKDDEASVYLEHMLDTIPDEGDCEKVNIYITSAKAAISRNTNLSNLSEKLSEIERRCLRQ